jgi:uncharacterized membrane protein
LIVFAVFLRQTGCLIFFFLLVYNDFGCNTGDRNKVNKQMKSKKKVKAISQISGKEYPVSELVPGIAIRKPLLELIKQKYPHWGGEGFISNTELNMFRHLYVQKMMEEEIGDLSKLEQEVLNSIKKSEILAKNVEPEIDETFTLGQKVADKIANFGGSWTFIISFLFFIILWMFVNVYLLIAKPFDPYPFILLNLILSCLAALQAPVIMMSQHRQESRDRQRSEHDYQINLKAELEIRQLNEKMDHLLIHQGQRLLEIQQVQVELMEEIIEKIDPKKASQIS